MRIASKQEGLAMELDGAGATLVDLRSKMVYQLRVNCLFRNNVMKMKDKMTSVAAKRDNVVRELGGK